MALTGYYVSPLDKDVGAPTMSHRCKSFGVIDGKTHFNSAERGVVESDRSVGARERMDVFRQ